VIWNGNKIAERKRQVIPDSAEARLETKKIPPMAKTDAKKKYNRLKVFEGRAISIAKKTKGIQIASCPILLVRSTARKLLFASKFGPKNQIKAKSK
jgi:hypothetical protein